MNIMEYMIDCDMVAEFIDEFIGQIMSGKPGYEHKVYYEGTKDEIANQIAEHARRWALNALYVTDRQIAKLAYQQKFGEPLPDDDDATENLAYDIRRNNVEMSDDEVVAAVVEEL